MKRFFYVQFFYLVVLMVLSSSAYAGHSFSLVVGRHRVRIEAPRYCHSPSCLSVSIPEIRETLDRYDNTGAPAAVAEKQLAPAPQAATPRPGAPAAKPSIERIASVPTATPRVELAAAATRNVAAPAPSNIQASRAQPTTPAPPSTEPSTDVARPATNTAARIARIVREADDASETPLGDWQTEGKGLVRIEQCGRALCGHVLNPSSTDNGELVLINMKPKEAALWSGKIYSHDSENTYYATIAMSGPDSLWVKACAFGKFYCSGNLWSRIGGKPEKLVISRQTAPEPRS